MIIIICDHDHNHYHDYHIDYDEYQYNDYYNDHDYTLYDYTRIVQLPNLTTTINTHSHWLICK